MLNYGEKIRVSRDKNILNEKKNHTPPPPPFPVKWSVPNTYFF